MEEGNVQHSTLTHHALSALKPSKFILKPLNLPFEKLYELARLLALFENNELTKLSSKLEKQLQNIEQTAKTIDEHLKGSQVKTFLTTISEELEFVSRCVNNLEKYTKQLHAQYPTQEASVREIISLIKTPCDELHATIKRCRGNAVNDNELLGWQTYALHYEQALICQTLSLQENLTSALKTIKKRIKSNYSRHANPRCFISYAWPDEDDKVHEYWVQPFLRNLHAHLRWAGIHALLDIVDNSPGGDIYEFMQAAEDSDFVILVCTESLLRKHHEGHGNKAVNTELNHIQRKAEHDRILNKTSRIYPLLLSGLHGESYPERFKMYSTVRDWRGRSYLENVKQLLSWLYPAEAVQEINSLYKSYPQLQSCMPKEQVHEQVTNEYYRKQQKELDQTAGYKDLQKQHQTVKSQLKIEEQYNHFSKSPILVTSVPHNSYEPSYDHIHKKHKLFSNQSPNFDLSIEVNDRMPIQTSPMVVSISSLNIGNSDFKSVATDGYRFVDKSLFIKDLIDDGSQVKLIVRPRRFGKTFNMSMVSAFFNVAEKDTAILFRPLKIWQEDEKYQTHQAQYPVIFLTFKDINASTFEEAYSGFKKLLSKLYMDYEKVILSSSILRSGERQIYKNIIDRTAEKVDLQNALKDLTEYLHRYYQKKVIILIDEYDTPIHASYTSSYYASMSDFIRSFLSPALKDNPHLYQAVLTGILRVAKESIFSGLNNISVYSVLSNQYAPYFGFTREEVNQQLDSVVAPELLDTLEIWYGGYQIAREALYNPWSVVSFIRDYNKERILAYKPYWINTSDNQLIQGLLKDAAQEIRTSFKRLIENQTLNQEIDEHIAMGDIVRNNHALWSFLLLSGYLTTKVEASFKTPIRNTPALIIPNQEIYDFYYSFVKLWFSTEFVKANFKNQNKLYEVIQKQEVSKYSRLLVSKHPRVRQIATEILIKLNEITKESCLSIVGNFYNADSGLNEVSARALLHFGKFNLPEVVEAHIANLSHLDPWIRQRAAEALVKVGKGDSAEVIQVYIENLKHRDSEVRQSAAEALVKVGKGDSAEVIQVYIENLKHRDSEVWQSAAEVLGKVSKGDLSEVIQALSKNLSDSDLRVRQRAAEALVKVGKGDSAEVIQAHIENLKHRDSEVRQSAAEVLGKVSKGDLSEVIQALSKNLSDSDSRIRQRAAEALVKVGKADSAEVIQAHIENLKHRDSEVRQSAAEVLSKVSKGDLFEVIQALSKNLSDSDSKIRQSAAEALGKVNKGDLSEVIQELIKNLGDSYFWVRQLAAEALGKVSKGDLPEVIQALIKSLSDGDSGVRQSAAEALGKLGKGDLAEVIQTYIGNLKHSDPRIRQSAAEALGKLSKGDSAEVIQAYIGNLKHSDPRIRQSAAEALDKVGKGDLPEVIQAHIENLKHSNSGIRQRAAEALDKVGKGDSAEVIQALIKNLNDSKFWIKQNAVDTLIKLGKSDLPQVIKFVNQNKTMQEDLIMNDYMINQLNNTFLDDLQTPIINNNIVLSSFPSSYQTHGFFEPSSLPQAAVSFDQKSIQENYQSFEENKAQQAVVEKEHNDDDFFNLSDVASNNESTLSSDEENEEQQQDPDAHLTPK